MSLKTKLKNDFWRFNYILPFIKKYQFTENGKGELIKQAFKCYQKIKVVSGKGPRSVGGDIFALFETIDVAININSASHFVYYIDTNKTIAAKGNILSNFTIDYDKIIHGTFADIYAKAAGNDEYGHQAELIYKAICTLRDRIICMLDNATCDYTILKQYFVRMLDESAEHFDEALQRILFFNQIMWQTRHRLNGLGRLDLILGDLYVSDIESGYISKVDAEALLDDFLECLSQYEEYKSDALLGDIGQIIILGGLDSEGSYCHNELTEMFLMAQARLRRPDPKTILRVSSKMPEHLLDVVVEALQYQTGSPLLSNDDVIVPALIQSGWDVLDAYNYCTSACWEPFAVGKSLDQNNIMVYDYFPAFSEILSKQFDNFDELVSEYIRLNNLKFADFLEELSKVKWAADPLVSMFTDGCSDGRVDVSKGGCKYRDYGVTTVALSNVVDSLFNIKKLVFEDESITLSNLNASRNQNYSDNEALSAMISNLPKHYGHDDSEVIQLVNRITSSMADVAEKYRNEYGGGVKFGLSSPGYNILSKRTGADVSGRGAGKPYNTHISCVDSPYTELINFAAQLDYSRLRYNGNVVDFFVSHNLIKNNKDKFIHFMKCGINEGFYQLQMNVMSSKMLIDAKNNPEKYTGLIVRVWGFSAYFSTLPESYKDLLIERALEAEKMYA